MSKRQLIYLDILIVLLQMLLTSIAYDTALSDEEGTLQTRMPSIPPMPSTRSSSLFASNQHTAPLKSTYVLDLRLSQLLAHLTTPPRTRDNPLPLPNTSSWSLPPSLRAIIRARSAMRSLAEYTPAELQPVRGVPRIPGGMIENGD